ncbi:MAG: glycosyltransferase [Chlorobi bacterium]|nr:glycosyltransferase [Chlorobiota bacterium]
MFEIFFLVAVALYFIQTVVFSVGAQKKFKKINDDSLPSATVIVAARNEESNILDCMRSLDALEYPDGKLEIIIANDHSTDRTAEIIEEFIKDKPKFKSIVPEKQIGHVKGKANAIANAIKISNGEIIMTTDADCVVSPTWAKTLASYYDEDVALVCGYTDQEEETSFKAMQSIDFIYLLGVAGGTMNLGKPLSCIGNNMSYRREAYEEIGGYEKLRFSVTEDFQVLMAMHNLKKYKIIYPIDEGGRVTSKACPDLKTLYNQKHRWGIGGLDSDFAGYFVMTTAFLTNLGVLLTPFLFSKGALYISAFKILLDYFFLFPIYQKLNLKLSLKNFIVFEIYFILYVLALPFALVFDKKVKWKGREF